MGHIATYNDGLRHATGDYVVLLSADDMLAPGCLARATALLESNAEVGFVYGYAQRFADQPPPNIRTKVRSWSVWTGEEWLKRICRRGSNVIFCPEVVMRTTVMRELTGYDPRLPHSADFHLWLRAAARASVGRVNGCDQAFYRIHGRNMHLEKYAAIDSDFVARRHTFDFFFAEDRDALPTWPVLQQQVKRSLASEALLHVRRSYSEPSLTADQRTTLLTLAEEILPQIRGGMLWRSCERWAARLESGRQLSAGQRARSALDILRTRVRWHRWYWYGT
jgi:glycosyltransferase involved in cell wall biosynthesis